MNWFHYIYKYGCNIHDDKYTNKRVILSAKNCGYQGGF
jgi:hypothetical protein